MSAPRKKSLRPRPAAAPPIDPELETPKAIAAVDDILAGIGLIHGSRATRAQTWSGGERHLTGNRQRKAERAASALAGSLEVLRGSRLTTAAGLIHGFSTRNGGVTRVYRPGMPGGLGDLNLGYTTPDTAANVRENRSRFLHALRADAFHRFALLRQLHTPIVRILNNPAQADDDFTAPGTLRGDAVLTDLPGVLLVVGAADCLPVLLFDPVRRVIGAFHAGWRGTLARIVERGVGTMRLRYGSRPADIQALLGPGIGPESYAVSEDLRHDFESQFQYAPQLFHDVYDSDPVREKYPLLFLTARAPGHSPIGPQLHLDLWQANRLQLLDAGLSASNIEVLGLDTAADTGRFFSHRAEDGFTGRMLGVIGLSE